MTSSRFACAFGFICSRARWRTHSPAPKRGNSLLSSRFDDASFFLIEIRWRHLPLQSNKSDMSRAVCCVFFRQDGRFYEVVFESQQLGLVLVKQVTALVLMSRTFPSTSTLENLPAACRASKALAAYLPCWSRDSRGERHRMRWELTIVWIRCWVAECRTSQLSVAAPIA